MSYSSPRLEFTRKWVTQKKSLQALCLAQMEKQATSFDAVQAPDLMPARTSSRDYIWHKNGIIVVWITHTFQCKTSTTVNWKKVCLDLLLFIETILTGSEAAVQCYPLRGSDSSRKPSPREKRIFQMKLAFVFLPPFDVDGYFCMKTFQF